MNEDSNRSRKRTKRFLKTAYLLPKNDFFIGMGSVFNIPGSYFNYYYSSTSKEADQNALQSDWSNVGRDIYLAMEEIK